VGEAMVAKHPPVESTASIRKRPGSRCGEHIIHPQSDQVAASKEKATMSASDQVAAANKKATVSVSD